MSRLTEDDVYKGLFVPTCVTVIIGQLYVVRKPVVFCRSV